MSDTVDGERQPAPYRCFKCGVAFEEKGAYIEHIVTRPPPQDVNSGI